MEWIGLPSGTQKPVRRRNRRRSGRNQQGGATTCVVVEELDVAVLLGGDGDGQRGVAQDTVDLTGGLWGDRNPAGQNQNPADPETEPYGLKMDPMKNPDPFRTNPRQN